MYSTTDNGYRSRCCLAPIKVGSKKIKKLNQKITVWVCCSCKTKDIQIITKAEADDIRNKDHSKLEPEPDNGFNG